MLRAFCPEAVDPARHTRRRGRHALARRHSSSRRSPPSSRVRRRRRGRQHPRHAGRGGPPPGRRDDGHGPQRRRGRADLRARAVRRRRGHEPDDVGVRAATGTVLGQEVEIAPPDTRIAETVEDLAAACPDSGQATSADFTLFGYAVPPGAARAPRLHVRLEDARSASCRRACEEVDSAARGHARRRRPDLGRAGPHPHVPRRASSRSRAAPWSSSTARPTSPSISTSTDCTSPRAGSSSPTRAN